MLQNEEFIQEFVDEARAHVESLEAGLVDLDENNVNPEIINTVFRSVHSIKGTAGFFGLGNIVELSHSMENILGEIRNKTLRINQNITDILLESNDCLKSMIEDVYNSDNRDISEYKVKLSNIIKKQDFAVSRDEDAEVAFEIIDEGNNDATAQNTGGALQEETMHINRLYRIQISLNNDLGKNNISPVYFFNNIKSLGTVIESYTNIENVNGLEECFDTEIYFVFIFSTDLDKKTLALEMNISEEQIDELDVSTSKDDFARIIKKLKYFSDSQTQQQENRTGESLKGITPKNNQSMIVEDTIRVHVSLLNDLMNLASEMVLGRNQLLRVLEEYRRSIPGVDRILQNIDHITTQLQEKVMQTRMQPIANVFNKFPRIIRDLSRKMGKEIELKLEGVEVELDKSIIEALADPLTHLVRNAADHGIEAPEIRIQSGKQRTGTIELAAYHEGGYVNIDITDDGAGVDLDKVKLKAIEKQLISSSEAAILTEQESLQLIFNPGFSTAEKVTDVSGRGVGMDVVKTNIEKLGGSIEIFSKKGQGTTFRLLLPLTLAIIPSIIVEAKGQEFALPQVNLQEIVRIKPGDETRRIESINNSEVLRLRERLLPIVRLSDVIGLKKSLKSPEEECSPDKVLRILVVKVGSKRLGIAVDSVRESEEILVKPLPKPLKDCRCYSGVTILGDGKVAMIMDIEGIIEKSNLKFSDSLEEKPIKGQILSGRTMPEQQSLLVFKCSGKETFAIDLPLVSRVEEIDTSCIERIGDSEYIKFRGNSLRVIRPENYLPVSSSDNGATRLYVIIPKIQKHPMGILIEKIFDTIQTQIELNKEDVKAKGIIGSAIINDQITLMINIQELFEMVDPDQHEYRERRRIP